MKEEGKRNHVLLNMTQAAILNVKKTVLQCVSSLDMEAKRYYEDYMDYNEDDHIYTEDIRTHLEYVCNETHQIRKLVHTIDVEDVSTEQQTARDTAEVHKDTRGIMTAIAGPNEDTAPTDPLEPRDAALKSIAAIFKDTRELEDAYMSDDEDDPDYMYDFNARVWRMYSELISITRNVEQLYKHTEQTEERQTPTKNESVADTPLENEERETYQRQMIPPVITPPTKPERPWTNPLREQRIMVRPTRLILDKRMR